jgi:CHAT domain-containing protein
MALSRAFRLAGAQSVTGSLWKTDLNSTLRLIDLVLASSLGIGESKKTAAALAFAKAVRSVRESGRTAAPYYWTPHVFIGNPLELNAGSQR